MQYGVCGRHGRVATSLVTMALLYGNDFALSHCTTDLIRAATMRMVRLKMWTSRKSHAILSIVKVSVHSKCFTGENIQ